MEGVHIYFEMQLDEEQILADNIYNLEKIYEYMDEVFRVHDCYLEKIEGKKRVYSRDVDNKDLGYLMMSASIIEKTNWFEQYANYYMLFIYDTEEEEMDTEEDWLEGRDILQRRMFRAGVRNIMNCMTENHEEFIKLYFEDDSYHCIEENEFLLFHKKGFSDYKTGVRLISVELEESKKAEIASLLYLMKNNELPNSVMVAFLKKGYEKKNGIQKLVRLVKKTKRTFRAIVLDITNIGWKEECDFVFENCYLTQRMYKNLIFCIHTRSKKWKIIPEDRQMLKGILYGEEYFTTKVPRKNECEDYKECGVNCFSFSLPVNGNVESGEEVVVDMDRLGWYMYVLIQLAEKKI